MKASFFAIALLWVGAAVADTEAERLLKARQAEFAQEVIEVAEGVYTAVGFGVSTSTMIVGDDGLVIIDTQIDEAAAQGVWAAFRKLSDKPVRAIVLTHGHGDHTGGVGVFAGEDNPQIWAREGFASEGALADGCRADHPTPARRPPGRHAAEFGAAHQQRRRPGLLAEAAWP